MGAEHRNVHPLAVSTEQLVNRLAASGAHSANTGGAGDSAESAALYMHGGGLIRPMPARSVHSGRVWIVNIKSPHL
jgi:hypothetical protein